MPRRIWLLSKAAPLLLRHFVAYLELAGLDLARTQRELTAELIALVIFAVCALFALIFGCFVVVAYTWDTPYRVGAIAWMAGGFLIVAVAAIIYRFRVARARTPLFAEVRREWQVDRVVLERLLSSDEEA